LPDGRFVTDGDSAAVVAARDIRRSASPDSPEVDGA
jgi:hypothetical protein